MYTAGENATTVDAASLSLLQVQCSTAWALDLEETPEVATLFRLAEEDRWRPGGEGYSVIEIEGDRGRIVADVHGGCC
ncbi:hypothetical protein [Candidatus Palauibacter sp.]|uniref:hypothetical protein n=1 Tax=Candidatus Palauibacter sp. TaxID=3101350 RepID=UPI003B027535